LGGVIFEHGIDVACSVYDADDVDAAVRHTVEDQVILETFDSRELQPDQAWVGRCPPLAHARHVGEFPKRDAAAS
jgi:hypothetical protein